MPDFQIPTAAFQASQNPRLRPLFGVLFLAHLPIAAALADGEPLPPTASDPPSYPTLAMPLGRQPQLITYFDNEFCVSDSGAACDVGSGWVRIDQGSNDSTVGLSTNYHVRQNDVYFGANVASEALLPVAEVVQADFAISGLPERNVTAGPSRVANGGGGIWELQNGNLVYVAPIPWSAGLLDAGNGSISGAWAFREGELYEYNGAHWVSQLSVEGTAGTVTSDGALTYIDESTSPPTLRLLLNSGFGFWYESAKYQGEEVAGWLSFKFSADWLVANGAGDSYGRFRRSADGGLVPVELWQREGEQDPYYWLQLKDNGTSFVRFEYVEPSAIELFALETNTPSLSISQPGEQKLTVRAPKGWAGRTFLILGTVNGTAPGILLEGDVLPINYDAYMHYLLVNTGSGMILPQVGPLDVGGKGVNTIQLPPGLHPECVGVVAHHLALLFDPADGTNAYLRSVGPATLELAP